MKRVLFIAVVLAVVCLRGHGQQSGDISAPGCKIGNLGDESQATQIAIKAFLNELQDGLRNNDREKIAGLAHYPLSVSTSAGKFQVHSSREFLAEYSKIFPEGLRKLLLRQRPECVSRVGAQGFTVVDGQVWFDVFPDGKVKMFTVTPVIYPGE